MGQIAQPLRKMSGTAFFNIGYVHRPGRGKLAEDGVILRDSQAEIQDTEAV
jgi:hypothetical protein